MTSLRRAHWYAASLILAWAVLTATCGACAAHIPQPSFAHVTTPAAIRVDVECPSGTTRRGSAVAVGPRLVTTAAHVVPCGRAAMVVLTLADGRVIPAYVSVTLDREDLAILLPTTDVADVRLRLAPARPGPVCFTAAAPERGVHCGSIERVVSGVIVLSGRIVHGNSGSGLFNAQGELVGIVTGRYATGGTAQALLTEVLP